jgi:hypothetical protein
MSNLNNDKDKFFLENTPKFQKSYAGFNMKHWKSYDDKIHFYKDYDTIHESTSNKNITIIVSDCTGFNNINIINHGISTKLTKIKINPRIYITGLPDNCFTKNKND